MDRFGIETHNIIAIIRFNRCLQNAFDVINYRFTVVFKFGGPLAKQCRMHRFIEIKCYK